MRSEASRAFDRRFFGVVEGLVVEIVDPDKQGRIKVRFPWYDDGSITEWCRVRQLYAGPGYGSFFVPEINDEVLIAFIHGDMRLPIVLGGLYNGKDKPPSDRQADDDKNEKLIRTKAGHLLLFDDTRDKEKIRLVTKGGHECEMHDKDKDGKQSVSLRSTKGHQLLLEDEDGKEKLQATTPGGHFLSLDDAGRQITVRTSGGQAIVMDASDGSITLSGVTLTLVGAVSIGLDAPAVGFTGATVSLGAPSVEIGAAPTDRVVLGDKLMALFNAHQHPIPGGTTGTPTLQMDDSQLSHVAKVE